jgi:hydroxymethylpyrimidine/phosphomethylpyrimidine kinase
MIGLMRIPNILSIAGSDPSGGAGIQADLKTFAALHCYGMAAITALTAQNTQGVSGVMDVSADFVYQQIHDVFEDVRVDAVKIGMLSSTEIIESVAEALRQYNPPIIVLDPVMVATSGDSLIDGDAVEAIKTHLVPLCTVVTPNIPEAEKLTRKAVLDMEKAAQNVLALGAPAVFLKGDTVRDILAFGNQTRLLELPRIETKNTHGTGCTLSSALASYLALGYTFEEAAIAAKNYLHGALIHASELEVGSGHGPVHHGYKRDRSRH